MTGNPPGTRTLVGVLDYDYYLGLRCIWRSYAVVAAQAYLAKVRRPWWTK